MTARALSEAAILNAILLALGARADCRVWRVNVVRAQDPSGRLIRSVPDGSADISGIHASGRRIELEVKSESGRVRPEQAAWLEMIRSRNGIAGVVRSVAEAEALIDEANQR